MAEALIRGLIAAGTDPKTISVAEPNDARREHLVETYAIEAFSAGAEAVEGASTVVLAVKPALLPQVVDGIRSSLSADALVISVAAGATIESIARRFADGTRIVRAMPNTPAMVLQGATAVAAGPHATEEDLDVAQRLFTSVGRCVRVPEAGMDAVTGLSGSGPAYVMLFLEALSDGGVRAGLPRDVATELAAQTLLGAAALHLETGLHPGVLKDRVTSPGGTTIAGVAALEAGGLRNAVIDAVTAATAQSIALGTTDD